ncbi:MAG TPA: hypothetical protein VIM11_21905 [Tepidisphaeraceae bacterium]
MCAWKGFAWSLGCGLLVAGAWGCASHDNFPAVPPEATKMVSGAKVVAFTAPHDGRIYLRDDSDRHMVYSGDVRKNQIVQYNPADQSFQVNGKVMANNIPNATHAHTIFFEQSDRPDLADRPLKKD